MNILVIGLNHKTADVEVREKLAFDGQKLEEGLTMLSTLPGIKEAIILSTWQQEHLTRQNVPRCRQAIFVDDGPGVGLVYNR